MWEILGQADLEHQVTTLGVRVVVYASLILIIATIIVKFAAKWVEKHPKVKLPIFTVMAGTIVISTIFLFASTIYLNTKSESKGPVHWHTDIEFWACGAEIDLRDPTGALSNKIGTATYHEHNDKRIHLEGVVVEKARDASLSKFMEVTNGYVANDRIGLPLNAEHEKWLVGKDKQDGDKQNLTYASQLGQYVKQSEKGPVLELSNGKRCGGAPAELQAFLYSFDKANKTYSQRKLDNPAQYIMRDEPIVPPADCLVVEFDVKKSATNRLCQQYGVRDDRRCTEFGVKEFDPELCNIREVVREGGLR